MLDNFKDLDLEQDWAGVKRAYFEQLKIWHPDRFGKDESLKKKGEEKTKEINQIFLVIKKHLGELENNGVQVEWDKPILPQLIKSGLIREAQEAPVRFEQEPLVYRDNKAKVEENKEEDKEAIAEGEENFWHPRLIAAMIVSMITFAFTAYFIAQKVLDSQKPKIVYGPPADLSKFAKKPVEQDQFQKDLEMSATIDQTRPGDGIVEGQLGGVRIIAGVEDKAPQEVPAMIQFASRCDLEGVKKEIAKGKSLNTEDADGMSSLSWAAKNNCAKMAEFLIAKGANVKHMSTNGFTPIAWARWFKNIDVIKVLELSKRPSASKS